MQGAKGGTDALTIVICFSDWYGGRGKGACVRVSVEGRKGGFFEVAGRFDACLISGERGPGVAAVDAKLPSSWKPHARSKRAPQLCE